MGQPFVTKAVKKMQLSMKSSLLVIFIIFSSINIYGQFIISGIQGPTDYLYNINPDQIIYAPIISFPSDNIDSSLIDINNDNIYDFKIKAERHDGGNWNNYISCSIHPLDNNQISIASFDTCFANNPSTTILYQVPIAKLYAIGDTINKDNYWIDSTTYLAYNRWSATIPNNFGYSCTDLVLSNSGYLGVKVIIPNDTLYGWIKIQAIASNTVVVEEYACNIFSTGLESLEGSYVASIFSNPFSMQSVLQFDNYINNASLIIYNSLGQQVKTMKNISGRKVVITRDYLSSGIYFLKLKFADNKIVTNKLIILD